MMQKKAIGKEVLKKIRTHPKGSILLCGGLLVLAALLYLGEGCVKQQRPQEERILVASEDVQNDALEERLVAVLSQIRGAGRVSVLITYESSGEVVTATIRRTDEDVQDDDASSKRTMSEVIEPATIDTDSGQSPIVLYEKEPSVRGVVVVAEGASDLGVRLNLQRAVAAVTGVEESAIEVFEMAKDA